MGGEGRRADRATAGLREAQCRRWLHNPGIRAHVASFRMNTAWASRPSVMENRNTATPTALMTGSKPVTNVVQILIGKVISEIGQEVRNDEFIEGKGEGQEKRCDQCEFAGGNDDFDNRRETRGAQIARGFFMASRELSQAISKVQDSQRQDEKDLSDEHQRQPRFHAKRTEVKTQRNADQQEGTTSGARMKSVKSSFRAYRHSPAHRRRQRRLWSQ